MKHDARPQAGDGPRKSSPETLYERFLAQREAGEQIDFELFCSQHPEQARRLRELRDGGCSDLRSRTLAFSALPDQRKSFELVRRAQADDPGARDQLVEHYYARVRRIAAIRMSTSLKRCTDPEDIVHRAFMVALRHLGDFRMERPGGLIPWLTRIVENQIRDAVRSRRAQKRDPDVEVPLDAVSPWSGRVPELAAAGPTPSAVVSNAELESAYDGCVQELDEELREVLLLRDYEGLDWRQVGEELGRPNIAAIQRLYYRAQLKLAGLLRTRVWK